MYTTASIDTLETLVGWALPIPPTPIVVDAFNLQSDSGQNVYAFSKLASVENMNAIVPQEKVNNETLNLYLKDLRRQAVMKVLDGTFVYNTSAGFLFTPTGNYVDRTLVDFDPLVTSKSPLFARAIGFQMAIDCIEAIIATPRINGLERSANMAYEQLKIELEGIAQTNDKGLTGKLSGAYAALWASLFPIIPKKPTNTYRNL